MSARMMYGSESSVKPVLDVGDSTSEASFCKFYDSMPPRIPGTVRLFDRTDYFSAHGVDALLIAGTVYKTHNVIKYIGNGNYHANGESAGRGAGVTGDGKGKGLPSLTLSLGLAKGFLREALTSKQMRVEIWEPEHAGGGSAGRKISTRWQLGREVSSSLRSSRVPCRRDQMQYLADNC